MKDTPKKLKQRTGVLAYGISAIKNLPQAQMQRYELEFDGRKLAVGGYALIIANRGLQNLLGVNIFRHRHRRGLVQVAVIKSLSPRKWTVWLVGRLWLRREIGGAIKTYRTHNLTVKTPTNEFMYDDQAVKMKSPLKIEGDQYRLDLLVSPPKSVNNHGMHLRLLWHRLLQRLGNYWPGHPRYESTQLAPNLFVGGRYRRRFYETLHQWGVTGIVNMRRSSSLSPPENIEILHLKTRDWSAPSMDSFAAGVDFIQKHHSRGGAVYVHCRQGEGRGPTMAAAYLISQGLSVEDALEHIKKSRPVARPNRQQRQQLAKWQKTIS